MTKPRIVTIFLLVITLRIKKIMIIDFVKQ